MNRLMHLSHLHLPNLTPYLRASAIQEHLVRVQLDCKAAVPSLPAPNPILLTFQTPPTYTTGRREAGYLSYSQIAHLQAGGRAEYYPALRGGQTTFHGPGQLTAYLILNLKAHGLDVKSYVRLLEDSAIGTCAQYGLQTFTTKNPGVWVGPPAGEKKLVSVGVHMRRQITSHGLGLNVNVELGWFDRIVMCGLEGKRATNIEHEVEAGQVSKKRMGPPGSPEHYNARLHMVELPISVREVADVLADNVARLISGVEGRLKNVVEKDVWSGETVEG